MKPSVLCISNSALANQGVPLEGHDLFPFDINQVPADQFHFINRGIVDTTDHYSFEFDLATVLPQILGYIIVKHGDEILSYARKHSGEARLLGSRSIGFGGHVDLEDYGFTAIQKGSEPTIVEVLQYSVERELFEELQLDAIDESAVQFKGLIVDTTNHVGEVHRGLLSVIEVTDKAAVTSTKETQDLKWLTIDQLKTDLELYENWSQIAIKSGVI